MNHMVDSLIRYRRLFFLFVKMNFLQAMEYRVDFITGIIPQIFYSASYIAFIGVILIRTPTLAGWGFNRMLLLFATSQLIYYFAWSVYRNSLDDFIDSVRDGNFDFVVKWPVNVRFTTSTRIQTPSMVVSFIGAIGLVIFALRGINLELVGVIMYIFLLFCGFVIYYNIIFSLATTAFWIIDASDLQWFADDLTRFGSYPAKVYPTLVEFLFVIIIPVLLLCFVPVSALVGELDWKLAIVSLIMVILTSLISQLLWKAGLRQYSSASS